MKILANREANLLLLAMASILLLMMAFGQFTAIFISGDYKQNMVAHDHRLAGYLLEKGIEPSQIAKAFTVEKTGSQAQAGRALLQAAGYTSAAQTHLFPEVQAFQQKYTLVFFVFSLSFSFIILAVLLLFLLRQNQIIEKANEDIRAFMDGNTRIRLDDKSEGSLAQFFSMVNGMATSLTTHIDNEKHRRQFLKDTISDISHQLKTPLAALKMYNEIIQNEQAGNEVVDEFASKSERELTRMEVLIQNLLKLARLDAGTIKLEKENHQIKEFLEDTIKGFHTRAELENKEIRLVCSKNITMNFDEEWLLEAVSNIIKNALDHTKAKDKIEIHCAETSILTTITITDNGTGIHSEDIHHIFKRFYRSRFSKERQGIGIGLTLSKAIIEKHGGSITVESKPGKGTAFRLTFPKLTNL
ncbi:sensor histidine kinase [Desulforamulus ruminis]|uniref:histidine kinase n=1 Tax=Desulforamulus ruminis (strain ATCC 23193 / DSM 2154 / NCIMB 8452 / DL) TaxID=696281 RepID=F6DS27_DESRL|nr:HAMP domain-containing sensor histidine kinase [Desulforamulus ruminis]AEG58789.1 ATP-binding region ATPase domain protein [Desulforamulus ruminis DSM 2154]